MANTTQRVLQLLGLLQARTTWQASALASELGVTERTVRRDIARLRDMGYPVNSSSGIEGGYQLGTGRHLPPLLLDDTEAVALVASLRMMALNGTDNAGTAALRALAKIDHILPPHLRALASAVDNATTALPHERPTVELQLLTQLATSQRDHTLVRFTYSKPNGTSSTREVEPARLMTQGELWYLQAFDKSRDDWRTFRLDRISNAQTTCWGFTPKIPPPPDFSSDIAKRYPCVIRVELESSPDLVAERIPPSLSHRPRGNQKWMYFRHRRTRLGRSCMAPSLGMPRPGLHDEVGRERRVRPPSNGVAQHRTSCAFIGPGIEAQTALF